MKNIEIGRSAITGLAVGLAIGAGAMTLAQQSDSGPVQVTRLSQRQIVEKVDGRNAAATMEVVTIEPGQTDSPHRHIGPVFGYVIEGEYVHAIDDQPAQTFKAGDTFYEPTGSVHRVTRNPNSKTRTRLLAVVLHPRDARDVTIREKDEQ
jgi:quercetin dioxygenase-like cupin family protein